MGWVGLINDLRWHTSKVITSLPSWSISTGRYLTLFWPLQCYILSPGLSIWHASEVVNCDEGGRGKIKKISCIHHLIMHFSSLAAYWDTFFTAICIYFVTSLSFLKSILGKSIEIKHFLKFTCLKWKKKNQSEEKKIICRQIYHLLSFYQNLLKALRIAN